MTYEENAALISVFMGKFHLQKYEWLASKIKGRYEKGWYGTKCNSGIAYKHVEEMEYHTSWDWLMPVVEKIESCMDGSLIFIIKDTRAFIELDPQYALAFSIESIPQFYSGFCDSKLEAAYKTVIQFITWYNQLNQPTQKK